MIVAREQARHDYGIYRKGKQKRQVPRRGRHLSRHHRLLFTGMVALAFFTGVVISFYYAQVFVTSYRIYNLQNQLVELQKETDDLYGEIAKLTSLERIEKVATSKLGMVKPGDTDVIKVTASKDANNSATTRNSPERQAGPSGNESGQGVKKNWIIEALADLVEQVKGGVPLR